MRTFSKKARAVSLAILSGVLGGAWTLWLIQGDDAKEFDALKARALCVLHLPEGSESTSANFTILHPGEMFHVRIRSKSNSEAFSLSIFGDQGLVGSVSGVKARSFGLGRNITPGTYTATLRQENKGSGGEVVIATEQPVYVTGWQIWSRTYVGLLALSGLCAVLWRKSTNAQARAFSLTAFHNLLLALVLIFVYLLFHEGGHALAQVAFGRFDLARSDFWGIHGHPHSGGTMGPALEPWRQTVISGAGPMLPTLAGLGLFVLWECPAGRRFRRLTPRVNLYCSAMVAFLVIPDAICEPLYLLGFMTAEGDLIGRVTESSGPAWLVKSLLWGVFLISAVILWRVLPEVWRSWKAQFLEAGASMSHAPLHATRCWKQRSGSWKMRR